MNTARIFTAVSRLLSVVFHPFLLPAYMLAVMLWGNTAFALYPPRFKFYLSWVVVLYTLAMPALAVGVLRRTGRVGSWSLDEQSDRVLPLAIGTVCYIVCAITVGRIASAEILRRIMLAAACCEMMCLAVNYHWKISLHMTAAGGCAAVLTVLSVVSGHLTGALAFAFAASGALASARLFLGKHTPMQAAAGFAGGYAVAIAALLLL